MFISDMEESNLAAVTAAPFVLKTYQMVSDPSTDSIISWGKANNSFVVLDPIAFSQRILPAHFKHNNFSSFVRQLNTYGFRKVDPDKWEFANEWFLRGQYQLLKMIVRKKNKNQQDSCYNQLHSDHEDHVDDELIRMELELLKKEQKELEKELQSIDKRLQATERRPQQMMAFLLKVAEDPEIVPRIMIEEERKQRVILSDQKKRRLMLSSPSSSSSEFGNQGVPATAMLGACDSTTVSTAIASDNNAVIVPSSVDIFCTDYGTDPVELWPEWGRGGLEVSSSIDASANFPFSLLDGGF